MAARNKTAMQSAEDCPHDTEAIQARLQNIVNYITRHINCDDVNLIPKLYTGYRNTYPFFSEDDEKEKISARCAEEYIIGELIAEPFGIQQAMREAVQGAIVHWSAKANQTAANLPQSYQLSAADFSGIDAQLVAVVIDALNKTEANLNTSFNARNTLPSHEDYTHEPVKIYETLRDIVGVTLRRNSQVTLETLPQLLIEQTKSYLDSYKAQVIQSSVPNIKPESRYTSKRTEIGVALLMFADNLGFANQIRQDVKQLPEFNAPPSKGRASP